MTVPLREYLAQRRADVLANIKAYRKELAEIDAAERALAAAGGEAAKPRRERGTSGTGRKTLKELAIDALREHPEGADAQTILAWIKERHGMEVARESMSPQLSRLGQEGTLARDGLLWRLVQARIVTEPQKDETPDAATSDASSLEEDLENEIPF